MPPPSRNDPYKAFNFLVEINGIRSAGFTECSGLSAETTVIEYREGNEQSVQKITGLNKFSDITLKRGLTSSNDLWQWINNIMNGTMDRRNGAIVLLADDRTEVIRFKFRRGWPCKWEGPHLNAKGSEVAIETLEITHEGLEVEWL